MNVSPQKQRAGNMSTSQLLVQQQQQQQQQHSGLVDKSPPFLEQRQYQQQSQSIQPISKVIQGQQQQQQLQQQQIYSQQSNINSNSALKVRFSVRILENGLSREFTAEHESNIPLNQVYNDIQQLSSTKPSTLALFNNGNLLPSDNTPLRALITSGDTVIAQVNSINTNINSMQSPSTSQRLNKSTTHSRQASNSNISNGTPLANSNSNTAIPITMTSSTTTFTSPSRAQSPTKEKRAVTQGNEHTSQQQSSQQFTEITPRVIDGNLTSSMSLRQSTNSLRSSQILSGTNMNQSSLMNVDAAQLDQELEVSVATIQPFIQLSATETVVIPAMITLNTKKNFDPKSFSRPNIDLVCVLDNSGSMHGDKLNMLKETLVYLIDQLNENDRLGLVMFNSVVSSLPMKSMDEQNKLALKQYVGEIKAYGGTDINLGMTEAFKFIKFRKYSNPVTSLFLLSDGLDSYAQERVAATLKQLAITDQFSISCFGFGKDHDPVLMNQISKLQDGSFYFIDKIEQVDMFFVDALGGLFSVMGQNVLIKVRTAQENSLLQPKIIRNYGDMWHLLTDKETNGGWEYCVKLSHLLHGVSKDFLCELQFNSVSQDQQPRSIQENQIVLQVEVSAFTIGAQPQRMRKQADLRIAIVPQNQSVPESLLQQGNKDVQLNYLRVRGAKALQECIYEGQQKRYKQGQQMLTERLEDIERALQLAGFDENDYLSMLKTDLIESRQVLQPGIFEKEGLPRIIANSRAHMEQRSKANNLENDSYQNTLQKRMVKKMLRMKNGIQEESSEEEEEEQVPEVKEEEIPAPPQQPVVEEVVEQPQKESVDLFKTFCNAAKNANVLYILEQEIPSLQTYFKENIEPKLLYDGPQSVVIDPKIQDTLSRAKVSSLLTELNKATPVIQEIRKEEAETLTNAIQDDILQTVSESGADLKEILDGDLNKITDFLLDHDIEELGDMPLLSEELSKKQQRAVQSKLKRLGTCEKVDRLLKAKGTVLKGKKAIQEAENQRQLLQKVLGVVRQACSSGNTENDSSMMKTSSESMDSSKRKIANGSNGQDKGDVTRMEALITHLMDIDGKDNTNADTSHQRIELESLLDGQIQKIQHSVLDNIQTALFNTATLNSLKQYFQQLELSTQLFKQQP